MFTVIDDESCATDMTSDLSKKLTDFLTVSDNILSHLNDNNSDCIHYIKHIITELRD